MKTSLELLREDLALIETGKKPRAATDLVATLLAHVELDVEAGKEQRGAAYYDARVRADRLLGISAPVASTSTPVTTRAPVASTRATAPTPREALGKVATLQAAALASATREVEARNAARSRAGKTPLAVTDEDISRHLLAQIDALPDDEIAKDAALRNARETARALNAARQERS